jgi:RNA polymerase sigma-70 factor (ECF subfamily)
MASDPDAALMLAFQGGDESAFRALFAKYGRAMVGYCHHYVRDLARAEELAQDVFLKLHRSASRYQPTARFKTFLYRIASNHCLNELRRPEYGARQRDATRQPGEDDPSRYLEDAAGGSTPEEEAMAAALARDVERLLASLPEKQRAAFVLARLEGLPYEEIADVLDTTLPAVKSLVHRATVAAAAALAHHAAPTRVESR